MGVPQGSILGPLFIIFMNNLPSCLTSCEVILYADTVIYYTSSMVKEIELRINEDLVNITEWFNSNMLTLNVKKSNFLLIGSSRRLKSCQQIKLVVQGKQIKQSNTTKYLGVIINENMTWSDHVKALSSKVNQRIGILKQVRHILPQNELVTLYRAIILPLTMATLYGGTRVIKF